MAYADTRANIKGSGFDTIKFKIVGDDAYYNIPLIRDGEISFETQQTNDTRLRDYPHSILCRVTFKTFAVDDYLIGLLSTMAAQGLHIKITAINTQTYSSQNIDATTGVFGCTWRFVCEGDFAGEQYIEFTLTRALTLAQYQLMLNAAPADGTPNAADDLYGLEGNLTVADIRPAAITKVEWKETSAGAYTHAATTIRNGRFVAEPASQYADTLQRGFMSSVRVEVSADMLQSSSTELGELDGYAAQENDYKILLADNTSVEFNNMLGIRWRYVNNGNADGIASWTLTGSGVMTVAAFVGLFA